MVIYGKNSVFEALRSKIKISKIFIDKEKKGKFASLSKEIIDSETKVSFVSGREIEKISHSQKHQGICAEIVLPQTIVEDESDFYLDNNIRNILILDGVTDTGNFGAIVRSALLFNCDLIILPKDNSARITPQVIKSSAGSIYKQSILYVNNLNTWLIKLKAEDFLILGFSGESKKAITEIQRPERVVCVIGSEHAGLRKSTRKLCDEIVSIPTSGKLDSLNAGVASAIVMWEIFFRQGKIALDS